MSAGADFKVLSAVPNSRRCYPANGSVTNSRRKSQSLLTALYQRIITPHGPLARYLQSRSFRKRTNAKSYLLAVASYSFGYWHFMGGGRSVRRHSNQDMKRRAFIVAAAGWGAAAAWGSPVPHRSKARWRERRELFPEGVASGDPDSNSVLFWTRYSGSGKASPPDPGGCGR